jgi:hypothetical protein
MSHAETYLKVWRRLLQQWKDLKQKAKNDTDRGGVFLCQERNDNLRVYILNPKPDGMVEKLQCLELIKNKLMVPISLIFVQHYPGIMRCVPFKPPTF